MKLNRKFLSFYYDGVEEFPDYVIEPKKQCYLLSIFKMNFV